MSHGFNEPPIDLDDTNKIIRIDENAPTETPLPLWRRLVGLFSLLGAAIVTFATAIILLLPGETPPTPVPQVASDTDILEEFPTITPLPTQEIIVVQEIADEAPDALPTLSTEALQTLLQSSPQVVSLETGAVQMSRNPHDPFTIIPDRPRSEVITHTVQEGDTIFALAERYGITPDSIAWSNDRAIIRALRPGRDIYIPPVDGAIYTMIGSTQTIASIAASHGVSDPYTIIDSEFNDLFGATPETVLPSGTRVFVPGGVLEQITWNPTVVREGGGGGGNSSGGDFVSFAPGEAGSCGRVQNVGGSFWSPPLSNYTWVRGFTSFHTGVDLAAAPGTPVSAANGGVVIFAGWNSYGYGNTVVLSHGPYTTLYGHLSSVNVRCGQIVSAGQNIAGVGSTGDSSGPHLHFEIRYLDQPQNPTATIPF